MERSTRSRCSRWFVLLVLAFVPGAVRRVGAQTPSSMLTVRLRSTVGNRPVPHATVLVVDAASDQSLAQGRTDDHGEVRFAQMPPTEIRVRLSGVLPDGTALRRTPQDTNGIWVNLP